MFINCKKVNGTQVCIKKNEKWLNFKCSIELMKATPFAIGQSSHVTINIGTHYMANVDTRASVCPICALVDLKIDIWPHLYMQGLSSAD